MSGRIRAEYRCTDLALTDSGTTALALAFLAAAPDGRRPRIALPAYGCFDLMTAADAVEAEVLFYDVDPATLGPDPDSLARAAGAGVHALVVAHWYGVPADLSLAQELARQSGFLLVEDAAQGVGASSASGPAGSSGDFGVLSFGRGKGRSGGHGGALLANSPRAASLMGDLASRLGPPRDRLADLVVLGGQWALARPGLYGIPASIPRLRLGETVYRVPGPWTRMTGSAAAVVDAVWALSEKEGHDRVINAERWRQVLAAAEQVETYQAPTGSAAGWLRFPVRATGPSRAALAGDRARRAGAMPGYPMPLNALPVAATRLENPSATYPGALELTRSLCTLPTHSYLRRDNLWTIASLLALDLRRIPL